MVQLVDKTYGLQYKFTTWQDLLRSSRCVYVQAFIDEPNTRFGKQLKKTGYMNFIWRRNKHLEEIHFYILL